ncbi:hypothetical protein L3X38_018401 [Prunus dulcis]|uniref:Uncharacterized protein n=1 Tax=Prunus dulcis TaxID=3755 RepID=A0AAD4ZB32_PRUDU|nr:hypothetical protein L3X38_018401 [Prunus dulcis]
MVAEHQALSSVPEVATYASAIPDYVYVRMVESSTDDAPCVDANDPDARIITFRPFYFSLGFMFPLSNSSGWCSAPWSVLQVSVLRTSTEPSCALRI